VAGWLIPEQNPADSVYGLVAIGALLAAESGLHDSYLDTALSALIAAVLYWMLHAYSTVLGLRLAGRWRLSAATIGRALAYHQAVLRGAAIPLAVLLLAWAAGAAHSTAVLYALWSTILGLVALELAAGVRLRASPRELLTQAAVGLSMGVGILSLKVVLH